ncbi:MAG: ribulose-phosphate 3-epimerase [Fimbriimonadaceae bacterium]|nr:ribulose-phosphate 3-epimerase [Fimbriimonadaceae bacterium]
MNRVEIAPSILSCDFSRVGEAVRAMIDAGTDRIHFDVMDGQFVPPITFGAQMVENLRNYGDLCFEAHLMTQTPEAHFQAFADAGADVIIFHAEATVHAHRLIGQLRNMGIRPGIAINPATPVDAIEEVLGEIDLALVMTVNPGWGGQKFIGKALEKVTAIHKAYPELDIEVDGGIDPSTIGAARIAGANVFVSGSYLVKQSSYAQGLEELRRACG